MAEAGTDWADYWPIFSRGLVTIPGIAQLTSVAGTWCPFVACSLFLLRGMCLANCLVAVH